MDPNERRRMTRDFDLLFDGIGLRAYTKNIDGVEVKFLGGTASSTAQDLYGDVITAAGQVKMLEKLRALAEQLKSQDSGLTAWLNHSYKIPEDTLGAFVSASLTTRTGDGITGDEGVDYIDLDIECRVTETNPRAVAAWQQVKDGIRHGWSIGAIFTEGEWMSDDPESPDYWSLLISDLILLEISLVGIPANQRAWCKSKDDMATKALREATAIARTEAQKSTAGLTLFEDGQRAEALKSVKRELVLKSLVHEAAEESAPAEDVPSETLTVAPAEVKDAALAETPPVDLAAALREAATQEQPDAAAHRVLVTQAAEAIDALSAAARAQEAVQTRDPQDGDGDPNRIALAISHIAKAVGHGLCVRSASHLSKACAELAAAVGSEVAQPGPDGDADPDALSAQLQSLNADIASATQTLEAHRAELAQADEMLAARTAEVATANESLATANDALTQRQAELAELEARIAERSQERAGRKSLTLAERVAAKSDAEVTPEHYQRNAVAQREALSKSMSAENRPSSGRDIVAAH